jgi:biotin carboxylase
MPRVLLVAATTGYQIRSFHQAAKRLGLELVVASDHCRVLDDPWRDGAIAIRFHDEEGAVRAIVEATALRPLDGVVAVGDRPAVIGARAARELGLRGSPTDAVRMAGNKLMSRTRLSEAGLPSPWFISVPLETPVATLLERVTFPCVVKPLTLAASRGVMRADTPVELDTAMEWLRALLRMPDLRALRDPEHEAALIEEYLPGREVALEGLVTGGALEVLAVFDKPDPLEGPFFEETIYVTPPESEVDEDRLTGRVTEAVTALGLTDGPIHAECRFNDSGVFVLEVAARPVGGLCSKALRFTGPAGGDVSLETLLLRHALGEPMGPYRREPCASGVMMIPIPREGLYKRVTGLDEARTVPGVDEVVITAKVDQRLLPVPEGATYLGFIFARAERPDDAVWALRAAHQRLEFEIESSIPVI